MPNKNDSRGFTLIELLVVIAIVALLIGILLPTLSAVRSRSRTTVCLSQSRQLVTAIAVFGANNRGRLPENRTTIDEDSFITWRQRFVDDGLLSDLDAWSCPDHPVGPISELGFYDGTRECVGDVPSSYALNGHLLWRQDTRPSEVDRSDASIRRPSHTILLAESRAHFPDIRVVDQIVAADDDIGGLFGFWHDGEGTYGFVDGHAETIGFLGTGSPDCRWHNGRDLSIDPFDEPDPVLLKAHDHPDWIYLVDEIYLD